MSRSQGYEVYVDDKVDPMYAVVLEDDAIKARVQKEPDVVIAYVEGEQGPPGPPGTLDYPKLISGQVLSGHRIVELNSEGKLVYSNSINAIGLTIQASEVDSLTRIICLGPIEDPSWNWELDKPIFQGPDGVMTQELPTTGLLRQVARVISSSKIFIQFNQPIILE